MCYLCGSDDADSRWNGRNIDCPESNNLHDKSSYLIIGEQVLSFSLGKTKNCDKFGLIAFTLIASALYQGKVNYMKGLILYLIDSGRNIN